MATVIRGDDNFDTSYGSSASVRVSKGANQLIANITVTAVTWDVETFDTDGMHDNSTNNTRLTAVVTGKYLVGAHITYFENTTNGRFLGIRKNGSEYYSGNENQTPDTGSNFHDGIHTAALVDLSAGDYVEVMTSQRSGVTLNILYNSNPKNSFWMTLVSK